MRILLAGLPAETTASVVRRLSTIEVLECPTWRALTTLRESGPFRLVVLGADGIGADAVEMVRKVRDIYDAQTLAILFVIPADVDADAAQAFPVNQTLALPASPEQIIRQVARLLRLSIPLLDPPPDGDVMDTSELARKRQQVVLARRLDVLDRTAKSRDSGNQSSLVSRNGIFEAEKLAQQLQDMGNPRGAQLATDVADLFANKAPTGESATMLVDRLRRLLTEAPEEPPPSEGLVQAPRVLFVDVEGTVDNLVALARNRGMVVAAAYDIASSLRLVQQKRPDVVVFDPSLTTSWDDLVAFFGEMAQTPPVPVLVYTTQSDQEARLASSRLGASLFVQKPVHGDELIERVEQLLGRLERGRPRVLAMDDDELALAAIQAIFEMHAIECFGLTDAREFWKTFEEVVPDLVILDFDMPHVNGLELCRMLRNDPAWKSLPILILTAVTDPSVVASVYSSGADDYASKPITAEELVGRVVNRLERQRILQFSTEIEPTTGLLGRRRLQQSLSQMQRSGRPLSVGLMGLDCFQDVNLAVDFESGDTMLRWMAGLLQRVMPEQALLGRWCSDEFVVVLPGMDADSARELLDQVVQLVRREVFGDMNGRPLRLSFSAGVVESPRDGKTLEELYPVAARCMAQAKRNGRGSVVASSWFETPTSLTTPPDVVLVHSDTALCRSLRRALQARGHHVDIVLESRTALSGLSQSGTERAGMVVVMEVNARNPDSWGLLRMFSRTKAAETTRILVLMEQTTQDVTDEAFSLGAWFVLPADAQFPLIVQRIREALEA